jgi:hypothetical protein
MTSLELYRHDLLINPLSLEIFCADLVEELADPEKAGQWMAEFVRAFEGAVEGMEMGIQP